MEEKKSIFYKIIAFFIRLFTRGRLDSETSEPSSLFSHFYSDINKNDPLYPSIYQSAHLCDDALRIAKHRIRLSIQLNDIEEKMFELENFSNLTDEEVVELRQMLDRFLALSRERLILIEQLSKYDESLTDMYRLEEDAIHAISQIKDAEKHQRALRQDIGYLQGEREELIDDRDEMSKTLEFIRKFTVGMAGVFITAEFLLIIMYFQAGWDIFVPTAILILLVMAIVSLLYFFRQKIRGELRRNLRKQHRAVELLNKKNTVMAYYSNYLRYSYKKYKIQNSRMLELNLKDFGEYKFLANRIDVCRSLMYETEESIERFVKEKKLSGMRSTIENFAETIKIEDKRKHFKDLAERKQSIENELQKLDESHEEIWDTLMVINERDRGYGRTVESIIAHYLIEAGKLFEAPDAVEGEEMDEMEELAGVENEQAVG